MKNKILFIKYFMVLLLSLPILLSAQTINQVIKTVASDRGAGDRFGQSVSISGNYAIVGAYGEDAEGGNTLANAGAAYIFKKNDTGNWVEIQKIVAASRGLDDEFGQSVSISGDYAIVGTRFEDEDALEGNHLTNAGAVYIFKKDEGGIDNWGQVQKIVAADRGENDEFGQSISISGNYVIVGATGEDEDALGGNTLDFAGAAYIFKKDDTGNWGEVQKIVATDRGAFDNFGSSVSISGDYAIVGVNGEDENTSGGNTLSDAGSAYIFKKDTTDNWGEVQKIVASDRGANDFFGSSVSISGDYAIIGAYGEDVSGVNSLEDAGAAYIFRKDTTDSWGEIQKIIAVERETNDYFGYSVSISGNYAIVGAYWDAEDALEGNTLGTAGAAYVFKKDEGGMDNWKLLQKIVAADRETGDQFGISVSISEGQIIVGANWEDDDTSGGNTLLEAGSVYIF